MRWYHKKRRKKKAKPPPRCHHNNQIAITHSCQKYSIYHNNNKYQKIAIIIKFSKKGRDLNCNKKVVLFVVVDFL